MTSPNKQTQGDHLCVCPGRQSGFKVGLVAPRRAPLPNRWQLRVTKWTKSGCLPMTGCLMATTPISSKAYGVIVVHTLFSGEGRRPEGLIRLTNHNFFLVGRDSRYGVPKYSRIHKDSQQRANTCNIRCKEIIAYLPRFSVSASRGKDNPSPPTRAHAHRIM